MLLAEGSPDGMKWNPALLLHATSKIPRDLIFPGFRSAASGLRCMGWIVKTVASGVESVSERFEPYAA